MQLTAGAPFAIPPFFGESVSVGEGVSNPWMLVGQLGLLLAVIFVADATVAVWRRGDRRQALVVGGSIVFFVLAATVQAVLVLWQIVPAPITASFFYLGIVVAMAYEMSREVLRAAQVSDDLIDSEARMTLAAELAKKLANPVASLISAPIQNNWDFGIGPANALRYTANVQPVIPFSLSDDWNLITRTILPIVYAESPGGPDWGLRFTVTFLFPK